MLGAAVTYAEGLDVVHGDGIAEEVEEGILEHAAVAVAAIVSICQIQRETTICSK